MLLRELAVEQVNAFLARIETQPGACAALRSLASPATTVPEAERVEGQVLYKNFC
ncbi:MAG: hypothetical protein HY863_02400 [Chloroflexi bacterium]|nr:hypothetical protein [Chloroflexota bacterium]